MKQKYYLYLQYTKSISDLIIYDIENKVVYNFYPNAFSDIFNTFLFTKSKISYKIQPDEYEEYIRDYSESNVFEISKEKFIQLSNIRESEPTFSDTMEFVKKYSLEEYII
jgi:hypothetical protein